MTRHEELGIDVVLTEPELVELAKLLYPEVTELPSHFEEVYPPRKLPQGAAVTRFAPSPTGFVHIGGIYASLISKLLAEQSGGVFFLRIEDTDQRREVAGGTEEIITALKNFQVEPTEGYVDVDTQKGEYKPYVQSQRTDIYAVYGKWLVENGLAYPCFCSEEELAEIAKQQEAEGLMKKGYYGKWAKHRNLSLSEIKAELLAGKKFVLRVRAPQTSHPIHYTDLVRGEGGMESNTFDMVLIKSNGVPTYHFAHVVDDHLMRTTHVTRGQEWMPSLPLHIQLFEMFGMEVPIYIHFSHIGKKEGGSVRKLSKRKDPEAAVSLYTKLGYHPVAVLEYLLNLANSGFSDWRKSNPTKSYKDFPFDAKKIGKNIALFDQKKLDDISRDIIAKMPAEDVYAAVEKWAKQFQPDFADRMEKTSDYTLQVIGIERNQERPRKDIVMWSEVPNLIKYFYDDQFAADGITEIIIPAEVSKDDAVKLLQSFINEDSTLLDKESWVENSRTVSEKLGFARELKAFKESPTSYKGHVGHLMAVLRFSLTHQLNAPDLYQVMKVMGHQRVKARLEQAIKQIAG